MKLYHAEWCPYCARVRAKMSELGVTCEMIDVPPDKFERTELIAVSGQAGVPTLVCDDGQVIADDDDAIIRYLQGSFGGK